MSCALRVNTGTQVKVKFHLLRRGAGKAGWWCGDPSPFAARSAAPYCLQQKCILFIAATSRRRHEPSAPSPSRHRCRLRVVCVNKKTMPEKAPAPAFSLPLTTLGVRLGRCAYCLFVTAHPQPVRLRGVALRCSFPAQPAMLQIRPVWLPKDIGALYWRTIAS